MEVSVYIHVPIALSSGESACDTDWEDGWVGHISFRIFIILPTYEIT